MSEWKPSAWMPLFIADYLADTQHLNTQQHGAYCLLLFASWNRGGSLPDDDDVLRVITRLSTKEWKAHRAVLADFFCVGEGKWVQKRLSQEMQKAISTTHRRSAAGRTGAATRWQGDGKGDGKRNGPAMANGMANGSQTDANSELTSQTLNKKHHDGAARGGGGGGDERSQWMARLNGYGKGGWWMVNHWGPRPEKPGCRAPDDLLADWRTKHGVETPQA